MKVGVLLVTLTLIACTRVAAQQSPGATNTFVTPTDTAEIQARALRELRLVQSLDTNSSEVVIMKKKLRISGPMASPFKATGASDFAHRVGRLFSPFVDEVNDRSPRYEPVSARAWSTIAGWNPGRSAFADDTWHEPQLRLITVNVEKQPAD